MTLENEEFKDPFDNDFYFKIFIFIFTFLKLEVENSIR